MSITAARRRPVEGRCSHTRRTPSAPPPRPPADIQSPEFEVRFTPNSGHSEAHAGLPVLTHNGSGDARRIYFSVGRCE